MKNILYAINNKLGSAEEKITEFEHITIWNREQKIENNEYSINKNVLTFSGLIFM